MVPAQEGLERGDATGVGHLDGLVHDLELVAGESLFEFRGEGGPFTRSCAHLVAVELAATPAALLCAVHRGVSGMEKRYGCVSRGHLREKVVGGHGHADTRSGLDLDAVQHEWSGDCSADALCDVERDVLVENALAQHHKFVACDARHGVVRARCCREPAGHGRDELVTHGVTDRVVHVLQLVEVDEEHCHSGPRGARTLESLGGAAQEQHSVGQSRQRVVRCQAVEFGACAALFGNVACDRGPVVHRTVVLAHDLGGDGERARDTVGGAERDLAFPSVVRAAGAGLQHPARQLVAHGLHVRTRCCVVTGSRRIDTDEFACGIVREREIAHTVEHDHRVTAHVEQTHQLVGEGIVSDGRCHVDCCPDVADDASTVERGDGRDAHPHRIARGR